MKRQPDYSGQKFVFVVCGSRKHIEALHMSLAALKRFSDKEIIVVTDTTRNETGIRHHNIIDIATPTSLTPHQASIYLKTGLYRFLPSGYQYCYLDTDVVAVDSHVDAIFDQFVPPVTFAKDHCYIDEFSLYAITCNCYADVNDMKRKVDAAFDEYKNYREPELQKMMSEIDKLTEANKQHAVIYAWHWLRYHLQDRHYYHLNNKYKLHKKTGKWMTKEGEMISDQTIGHFIRQQTGLIRDEASDTYVMPDGSNPFYLSCTHLRRALKDKWGVDVTHGTWQHWNGGVFLFNDQAHEFMAEWHHKARQTFEDPDWVTRDQGALIATTWQKDYQNHPTIDKVFNFIVDANNEDLKYLGHFQFQEGNTISKPHFLHLINNFGDQNRPLRQDIDNLVNAASH